MSLSDKCYLIGGLGAFAWAFWAEARIRALSNQLIAAKEKDADSKIVSDVHALSDADLNREASEFLGGSQPTAGTKS